ncbi:AAA family ATPase [Prevotella communis]|uniref:AAA family ATPase n=1 Tax=Prevotella communis TaxID=2913614 RepID=UPI001EDB1404|nr:AAA family ATPase [Prevotella communis]UKK66880.1 AAA family ATPase [Prevotella communis]
MIFDKDNPEATSKNDKAYSGGIDLADKGMGSIQIVILLLRIATLIRKYKGQQLTVLLEEPEQNLHPAMQSKIADLINYVNIEFGLKFIIETHSEYLIRKTQVIVAELNKSVNRVAIPFKVIYLPDNDELPYDMQYRPDGKFSKEFGAGFFDEAAKLAFKIF